MKTSEQFYKEYQRAIRALSNASDFDGEYGVPHAIQYLCEALKELLFIKNELEASIQKEAKWAAQQQKKRCTILGNPY